jgi:insulysin
MQQGAMDLVGIVENTLCSRLGSQPLLPSQHRRYREVQLPDGGTYMYRRENGVHNNNALAVRAS